LRQKRAAATGAYLLQDCTTIYLYILAWTDEKLRERNACEAELANDRNRKEEAKEIRNKGRYKQVSSYAFNTASISQAS
jgi:hypothetical protein